MADTMKNMILTPTDVKEERNVNECLRSRENLKSVENIITTQSRVAHTEISDATAHMLVKRPVFMVNKIWRMESGHKSVYMWKLLSPVY